MNAYLYQFYFGLYAAVVIAVTELGHGKPRFYSTPQVIAFCQEWRLPTKHVWLFSTRLSSDNFTVSYVKVFDISFHSEAVLDEMHLHNCSFNETTRGLNSLLPLI